MTKITFSLNASQGEAQGNFVLLQGKCFELGTFADKGFSLNEEEADTAAREFKPVPMNYQHVRGPLDKKNRWGEIQTLERRGTELFSKFSVPKWLYDIYKEDGEPLKVSLEWGQKPKRVTAGAWVENPRIVDAHVAVFSENAPDALPKETLEGAQNEPPEDTPSDISDPPSTDTGLPPEDKSQQSPEPKPQGFAVSTGRTPRGNLSMNEKAKQAYLDERAAEGKDPSPSMIAMFDANIKAEKEQIESARRESAVAFSTEMAKDSRILGDAQQGELVVLFCELARLDSIENDVVKFSAEPDALSGKRTDLLRKFISSLPQHNYTQEVTKDNKVFALGSGAPPDKSAEQKAEESRNRILASTALGQAILKEQKK